MLPSVGAMKLKATKRKKQICRVARWLLTAAAILLLSVGLTLWRHNGSSYLTGFWDNGSQTLVFGRMLQMQQNQHSPGGFMGVYTQDWSDQQNRYWYRDNTPVDPAQFQAYTHQSGLQGWGLGILNKVLSVFEDSGEARETMLYTANSILFYAATLCICLAVGYGIGWGPALAWLTAAVFAPWPQRGMKDLYWCLWTWWLPALAGLLLCAVTRARGKTPRWCYFLVFAACLVRCMCGFEFISVFLILCEIPLVFCWAEALCARRPARPWVGRMTAAGLCALGGVAAALGAWFLQGMAYYGSAEKSWANLSGAVTSRVSLTDGAVSDVTVGQVLRRYLLEINEPLVQIGPVTVTLLPLAVAVLAGFVLCALALRGRGRAASRELFPLFCVWVLSFAAPLSWMVLSKAHSYVHTHLVPMLWHFAFVPVSGMVLAALICRGAKALLHKR